MRPPPAVESSTLRHHGRGLLEERGREGERDEGGREGGEGGRGREGGRGECPPPVQESSTVAGGGMHALVIP